MGMGWVGGGPFPTKAMVRGRDPGWCEARSPRPQFGMCKTRGQVQAGLRLLPPPSTAGPTEGLGGQNPPQQRGRQVDARQHKDLRERD